MSIKISADVEPPPAGRSHNEKFPLSQMNVGDSIELNSSEYLRARNASYQFSYRHGWKFTARKTETGGRIWRIK